MILVTGAAGFVGRHVVKALREAGHPVRALLHTGRGEVIAPYGVEVCYGDVRDTASLRQAMERVDTVVHLVSIIREKGSATFQRINHQGTANVVSAAREAGVRRFLHMSVLGAQDQPAYPYLYSKWQGEQAVTQGGIPYTILCPSFQFGEGDEFFNRLAAIVRAFPIVPISGSGRCRFQPISVEDVARCVGLALTSEGVVNRTVEIGGPGYLTYDEMTDLVACTLGVRRVKVHIPFPLMQLIVRVMGVLLPRPPVALQELRILNMDNATVLDAVERHFGFRPRPIEGSIEHIRRLSYGDALKATLGAFPRHIRDH